MDKLQIHKTAEVSHHAHLGAGTIVWNQAQIREDAILGKKCIVGKNVYIDKGVVIGNGVKIQNNASIYFPATLEDDVFVGPAVTFTNDLYPRAFLWNESRVSPPTIIKKGASIGANATIICGITIGEYAMVAAGAVVTRDVPSHMLVRGVPARSVSAVCRCGKPVITKSTQLVLCKKCGYSFKVPALS
ncbi:MAG: acyltransferase [Nanoarchaeota archaeon]